MKRGSGRPTDGYHNAAGERIPGTTSITGRGKDSGGLIFVAKRNWHEAGRQGKPFDKDAYWSDGDALLAGTVVHAWIEDSIHGQELTVFEAPQLVRDQANVGFMAYTQWRKSVTMEILETEVPMVSEQFQYGGTIDAIGIVNGERCLVDYKTSKATYVDYLAQLAAYRHLVNEAYYETGDGSPIESAHLLRVDKEYGSFHHHWYPSAVLDDGWKWFLAAKTLYELDKKLKKVAA